MICCFAVSALVLPLCVPLISDNRYGWILENDIFCSFWGILWYVFSLGSIFLVATLSITRTTKLVWPFWHQRIDAVVGIIVGYFVFLFIESSIPLWFGMSYQFEKYSSCVCSWRSSVVLGTNSQAYTAYSQIYLFQAYFPIFPIIISCGITIRLLKRSESMVLNRSNRSISVTIVLFTILFIICNAPPVLLYLTVVIERHVGTYLSSFDYEYGYFYKFSVVLTVCINSALNSVVYFYRMESMRIDTNTFLFKRKSKTVNAMFLQLHRQGYQQGRTQVLTPGTFRWRVMQDDSQQGVRQADLKSKVFLGA